ncbi:MAG: hypothetical protein KBE38_15195 [Ignavibacterium sp.]|nr:hypothetical protein [Ignavibacterium sp.]
MKTKYKFIYFEMLYDEYWSIYNNRTKNLLGEIKYYKKWKEFELYLERDVAFTKECLLDVVNFMDQLKATEQV